MTSSDPQYGIPLDCDKLDPQLSLFPVYGITPSNKYIPLRIDETGQLQTSTSQEFARIYNEQFNDNEEVRLDTPVPLNSNFAYAGVALSGSSVDDPVWSIIRTSFDINGRRDRIQFRVNLTWTGRTQGW
jgi:hypothetical protein